MVSRNKLQTKRASTDMHYQEATRTQSFRTRRLWKMQSRCPLQKLRTIFCVTSALSRKKPTQRHLRRRLRLLQRYRHLARSRCS